MKTVLLVGSNAVLGRGLRVSLENAGLTVTTAGRKGADIFLDLLDPFSIRAGIPSFDCVVMTAADFGGTTAEDLDRAVRVNALGVLNVCRLATAVRARRFVLVSSLSASYNLGDPYFGAYSLTKRHGEDLAMLYSTMHNLSVAIVRPSQIYNDDGECRHHQKLFYTILERAAAGKDIEIDGPHDPARNFIHLEDVSEIVSRLVRSEVTGVYECPHPRSVKLSELARIAQGVFRKGGEVRFLEGHPSIHDVPEKIGEPLFRALGYTPLVGLEKGVQRIKEFRERRDI